jgi:class 3 adenylate cyclase
MAENLHLNPLTGHREFDGLIAAFANLREDDEMEVARAAIWEKFGVEGAVFISDMASFSSTSRKIGVCHFLKMIHRARQMIAPLIADNNGLLLKCDADNCYAFFERPDDAIRASFDVNAELFAHNEEFSLAEQIYLSVGIDYGRVLLVGDIDFFGDPVNTASKLGEDLAVKAETLVTKRAIDHSAFEIPDTAERMVARISEIEIKYVRLPMTEIDWEKQA